MKNNIKILVSGGAGYVGSVISHDLKKNKISFAILDNKKINLSFFPKNTIFFRGDISNVILLEKIYKKFKPTHIIHLAAKTNVIESERFQNKYKINNIVKSKIFFNFFLKKKVKNFLFASSAAVYSNNSNIKRESLKEIPANYYGKTKLAIERYLLKKKNKNLNIVLLRFFNIVGSHNSLKAGNFDLKAKNLFSAICRAILKKKSFILHNNNLPTADGSSIRDFIDVNDISKILITLIKKNIFKYKILNLGVGRGYSVYEVVNNFEKKLKKKVYLKFSKKNKKNAKSIIASNALLKKIVKIKFTPLSKSINNHYKFYKNIFYKLKYL